MIGTRVGPYEITAKLGEGGMGEVYRAADTRLRRDVAIKVLPAAFTEDKERLARFEREAQLLAQLQHPNVASVYGLEESGGIRALVMELVEGPTLSDRLQSGPLAMPEIVAIARQIAEALEEAHEKGIVHRDLKPQNVKAPVDGKVKVLDFGLAKAMDADPGSASSASRLAQSPTLTFGATQLGVILGTAAYMSPEQAKGSMVDKRADIWAFGVVLWEMLAGKRLFEGDTVPETLGAVFRQEIDFSRLPAATPPALRHLVERCLERDPKLRLRDIGEARVALQPVSLAQRGSEPAASSGPSRSLLVMRAMPWALAALLAAGLAWIGLRDAGSAVVSAGRSPVLALHLPASLSIPLDNRGIYGQTAVLAIAPDGSRIAFLEGAIGKGPIYVREIDAEEFRPLEGTEGASSPFFSPDGHWIGYFSPGKLRKIAVAGGRPIDLAEANLDRGGAWCPDGSIVFAANATSGLLRLPPGGGPPVPLTKLEIARGERTHRWPAVLPGGREVAFTVGRTDRPGDYEGSSIDAVDLATGKRRPLLRGASMVRFTPGGLALLGRAGQVLAMPLAGAHGQTVDDAREVLHNVAGVPASGIVHFDVAADGTLVYAERSAHSEELELTWFSNSGEARAVGAEKGEYRMLRFSPDGRRLALAVGPGGGRGGDVWMYDRVRGGMSKLTFDGHSWAPIWTRDGANVTYAVSLPSGSEVIRQRPADGSRDAVTIAGFADGKARGPVAWMADGSLLYWEDDGAGGAGNILYLPPGSRDPRPFAATPAIEIQPSASPDGRYAAYVFDETGEPDVYVQPFPPTGAKWQVAAGASVPRWSADGRELYFVQGRQMMAVSVTTSGTFATGAPRKLFDFPNGVVLTSDTSTDYDVAPDGRFLAVRDSSTEPMGGHLVVVLNWFAKLKRTLASIQP